MIKDDEPHYLLDTNIVSELSRYRSDFNVLKKMAEHSSDMAISVIVLDELLTGAMLLKEGRKKEALLEFIQNDVKENFKIKVFDEKAAEIHAQIYSDLLKKGSPVSAGDTQIAAIAIAENMTLVTRNTKHYESIATQFGLKMENWFEG